MTIPQLHPEILKKNGNPQFVVLPYEEYQAIRELMEDFEDLVELRSSKAEQKNSPSLPLQEVKKLL